MQSAFPLKKKGGIRVKKYLLGFIIALLSIFAMVTAVSACFWGSFQPILPKSLK
jgi:cyclic lactone autoinducer peptide